MALKQITAADFNAAIKKLTTSDASVWWKTLGTTEDGTELCFVIGWNDGYDEDDDDTMYQQDGYTLCSKIGYKPSKLMVMDYTDFNMPYDKKTAEVWDTDMSVGKGEVTNDSFDVKWYNDEAKAIWRKYGKPNKEGTTALDLMESKQKESKKNICSMQKKIESFRKNEDVDDDVEQMLADIQGVVNKYFRGGKNITIRLNCTPTQDWVELDNKGYTDRVPVGGTANAFIARDVINKIINKYYL